MNYMNTTFDDEAVQPIVDSTAPSTGHFKPVGRLALFEQPTPRGKWTLRGTSYTKGNLGNLLEWKLIVYQCVGPETSGRHEPRDLSPTSMKHRAFQTQALPTYSISHNFLVATLTMSLIMNNPTFASGTTYLRLSSSSACSNNVAGSTDVLWSSGLTVYFTTTSSAVAYVCFSSDGGATFSTITNTQDGSRFLYPSSPPFGLNVTLLPTLKP